MAFLQQDSNQWLESDAGHSTVTDQDSKANKEKKDDPNNREYLAPAIQEKNVKQTTILFSALFVAGLLCLWFMIHKSSPQSANAQVLNNDLQIEAAIAQATGIKTELSSGMDDIVKKFNEFSQVNQISLAELEKDPFVHEKFYSNFNNILSELEEENNDITSSDSQLHQMQLKSVIQTEFGNCCMIGDKVLYKDDHINGYKIEHIGQSQVELSRNDEKMILTITRGNM